jgi:hypothetical protein
VTGDPGLPSVTTDHTLPPVAGDPGLPSVTTDHTLPPVTGEPALPSAGEAGSEAGGEAGSEAGGEAGSELPEWVAVAHRIAVGWTRGRLLGPTSLSGIGLALGCCAAVWFTAGTPAGNLRAVIALAAGYLVIMATRRVADWSAVDRRPAAATAPSATEVRWRLRLAWSAAECAVYAGLAAGAAGHGAIPGIPAAAGQGPPGWTLAAAVAGLVAVRDLMTAASTEEGRGGAEAEAEDWSLVRRAAGWVTTMAPGGRVLLIGFAAVLVGGPAALTGLAVWAVVAICCGLAAEPCDPGEAIRLRDDGVVARWLGGLVHGYLLPLPPAVFALAATAGLAYLGLGRLPGILTVTPPLVMLLAAPGSSNPHDGRLDWLVAPVLLGWQFLYLVALGVAVAVPGPVIFLLCATLWLRYADLACPGRPVLLAAPLLPGEPARERGSAVGWEGRTLLAGAIVAVGLGTLAYLALAAYLAFLTCAKVAASQPRMRPRWPPPEELRASGKRPAMADRDTRNRRDPRV